MFWIVLVIFVIVSLLLMTIGGSGMYSITVVLPQIQAEFGISRSDASLPYTLTMVGFGLGGILMGRLSDRYGVLIPIVVGTLGMAGVGDREAVGQADAAGCGDARQTSRAAMSPKPIGKTIFSVILAQHEAILAQGHVLVLQELGERVMVVTPGIRPVENRPIDDQKRTVDVAQAFGERGTREQGGEACAFRRGDRAAVAIGGLRRVGEFEAGRHQVDEVGEAPACGQTAREVRACSHCDRAKAYI